MERTVHETLAVVEEHHWWWRTRREIIADVIAHYAPRSVRGGLRIVEVGCGHGGNLAMLADFGRVIGAEADRETFETLRATRGAVYEVIQQQIPEPLPGRYHVIGMFDVLEHIADDRAALRWVERHLEADGLAVITVPAFEFLWSELDTAAKHFRRYTAQSLRAIVPETLQIEHLTYFNSFLFPAIAAARAAMHVLPRRLRPSEGQLDLPPGPVNWLLHRIFRLERRFVIRGRFPAGVSLLLVLRRRSAPA